MTNKKQLVKPKPINSKPLNIPFHVRRKLLRTHGAASEISRIAGVSRAFVSYVLHGRWNPSPKVYDAIAHYILVEGERMASEGMRMALKERA